MEGSEELYPSYIVNCVFNTYLCYTAIILNSVTIHALRKTSSLPKPLKTLLLSLAVSDLGVGLLVQPMYIAVYVMELERNTQNNPIYNNMLFVYLITLNIFFPASFFGVMALSADRFLAIRLHLRYQELVTHKRVIAVVISIWFLSSLASLIRLWTPVNISFAIFAIIAVFCLLGTTLIHYKIYVAVRRHANQISRALQVQQVAQNGEMENAARMRKFAVGALFVYLAFLVCYLPRICTLTATAISGTSTTTESLHLYSLTLAFLNSSLNPLIYCWKMRQMRHAVMDILRNILRSHN